jgi:group I intron endonuclease
MAVGIYKITFGNPDKVYIGSSIRIEIRWSTHKSELRGGRHSHRMQNAYNKYGEDAMTFEIVEELPHCVSRDYLIGREQYYIDLYDSFNKGLNMSPNAWTYIKEWTEEDRQAKSIAMTGENNHFYGKTHSEETKKLLSERNKNNYLGENNPFFGKTHSEETRLKISKSIKATNAKQEKHFMTGKPKTEESIRKMKENMPHSTKCVIHGVEYISISEAAKATGILYTTLRQRIKSKNFPEYQERSTTIESTSQDGSE